ncbi:hypothetical protein A1O7_07437 [Cladophialophora yegresii CBS 114405]|uniref:MIND kinetochore complex component Nnf1 n=1 Tax=Cladophialophora yegresii CBS 114405 TaxID=1182544 RepID=W9VNI6_9EURO|nr:uncharacterized protein A1O7_07437 [Cladophialophora yegresii CBS 114405]EXJ57093.1 hypothetical protein A1O7_07437 [Cladophialophora yegresii CBS 114405]
MNGRTSASPSPPPQTPVASAPGPRATALHKVFAGALSASIKANSYANFSSCFPTPAKYCPNALEGVWAQLNTRLEQECMRDFEQILEDRHVVEGLNQWEDMIEEARKRKNRAVEGEMPDRPLHTLSAEELYAAHLTPYLQKVTDELNTRIQNSQQENAVIFGKISDQRAEIERLLNGLQHVVYAIEGSVDAMRSNPQIDYDALRNDVWQMEQEVSGTR